MKKILLISMLFLITVGSYAQQASKVHTQSWTSQGNYVQFDSKLSDTLKSNDTVSSTLINKQGGYKC